MRRFVFSALAILSGSANAALIVIEPDDFAAGTQITSDHATILSYNDFVPEAVFSTTSINNGYAAPTGSAVFGGQAVSMFMNRADIPMFGLMFEFDEPVESVSIWALNWGYGQGQGLHLDCNLWTVGAVDMSGACDGRLDTTALGEARQYTFTFGGQAFDRITIGGGSDIGAFVFDRLEARTVPEPSTLALGGGSLLAGLLLRRRRTKKNPA